MKHWGRLARWAPLFVLPALSYRRVIMDAKHAEGQKVQPLIKEGAIDGRSVPLVETQTDAQKHKADQNQSIKHESSSESPPEIAAKSEQQKVSKTSEPIQENQSQTKIQAVPTQSSSAAQSSVTPQIQQPKTPSNQQLIQIERNLLQVNQAIVSSECPTHILSYLKALNLTIKYFTIRNKRSELLTIKPEQSPLKDELKLISNFINPPLSIETVDQMKQQLKLITKQDFIVASYIPYQSDYEQLIKARTTSPYDTFTSSRKADLAAAQKSYVSLAYNSSSSRSSFLIIRSRQVADYMKMNSFRIGEPLLYSLTSKQNGNESNCKLDNQKYLMRSADRLWLKGKGDRECINKLAHHFISVVEDETQLENKIRQMQMAGDNRKLLVFHTDQRREQFHKQTDQILEKVARMQRQQVVVVKVVNQRVLRRTLRIQPDSFATIRLLNLQQLQKPLFQGREQISQRTYSRSKYRGPFKVQNLCEFVISGDWKEHYESKKNISYVKPATAQELKGANNTLVLMQKQGCSGCRYMLQSLDELKKVVKSLKWGNRYATNMILRYKIEDKLALIPLKIRRYSIYNEDKQLTTPTTTPKLFMFSQGKYTDIRGEDSLTPLTAIKTQAQAVQVHDVVLADIIAKITRFQNDALKQQ